MDSRPVLDVIVFSPGMLVLDSCALMNWSFLSRYGGRDEMQAKGGGTSRLAELSSQFEAVLRKDQCLNCNMLSHSCLKLLKQAQRRAVAVSTPPAHHHTTTQDLRIIIQKRTVGKDLLSECRTTFGTNMDIAFWSKAMVP